MLRALTVLAACSGPGRVEASTPIRGVAPSDQAKYDLTSFRCFSGSEQELPPSAVNDDFCDCADGSDEPGTGACAGQTATLFYCPNAHSDPAYIYSSRVNDGICDCCDGSDEWRASAASGGRAWPHPACTDTCAEEGRRIKRERDQQIADLRSGIKQRNSLIEKAKVETRKNNEELQKLRAELPRLESQAGQAKAAMEAAQRAVDAEEARRNAMNASNASNASTEGGAAAPDDAQQAAFDAAIEEVDAKEGSATEPAEKEKPVVSEYSKWMDGAEKVLEEATKDSEPDSSQTADGAVVSEYSKWMDGAEKVLDGAATGEATGEDGLDDDGEDPEPPAESPAEPEPEEDEPEPGFLKRILDDLKRDFHRAVEWLFGATKSPVEAKLQQAKDTHREAEKKVKESKTKLEELEKKLGSPEDEEQLAYSGLDGRCIEKKIGEYKYQVCFFKDAKQDTTSVGRWKGWDAPGVARFDGGSWCPGGPERSLKVRFRCGSSEELLEISEPSRCTYEAEMKHPAACTPELLQALETQGPRMPTDEL